MILPITSYGVLFLRLQDESAANRVRVVKAVLDQYADFLKMNFIVATRDEYAFDICRQVHDGNEKSRRDHTKLGI